MTSSRYVRTDVRTLLGILHNHGLIPNGLSNSHHADMIIENLRDRLQFAKQLDNNDQIYEKQREMLGSLLSAALESVPFYQQSLSQKYNKDIAIDQLPFLVRSDLRENWQRLVSNECNNTICDLKITSGTTGVPVKILQSTEESFASLHYDLARVVTLANFNHFQRWESPFIIALTDNPAHPPFSTYNPILDKWVRFEVVDPSNPTSAREIIKTLESLEPAVIVSRPSALKLIAEEAANGHNLDALPLPIVCSGANLYSDDRERIESSLGGCIADLYAISECSGVASQCPHGGYHIHWEQAIVEIIDPDTGGPTVPGAFGEIVVTDLMRRAMPIIRYRTGDVGRWTDSPCPCGIGGPVIKAIDGRQGCYFKLPDGRVFNPSFMNGPLSRISGLDQYRVNQTQLDALLVEYVASDAQTQEVESELTELLLELLPWKFLLTFKHVNQLASPGAKVERYVSIV